VFPDVVPKFVPAVNLIVDYGQAGLVCRGNAIAPAEAALNPNVSFSVHAGLWSLIMTCMVHPYCDDSNI